MTIFGLLAMPGISSVKFELGPRGVRSVSLSRLSADDAETAGVSPLAYAGFAMAGEVCISGVEGLGAAGEVVYRDSEDDCGS